MKTEDLYAIYCEHPVVTTDSRKCPEGSIFIEDVGGMFPTLCDFFLIMCVAVKTLAPSTL